MSQQFALNPLLQACIDEFGIAAVVYFVGREVDGRKFGAVSDLAILRKLRPWIAGWCPANDAAALAAAADQHLANHRHDSPAVSVAKAASRRKITLTEHGSVMRRAESLIGTVNEKFREAKKRGELRALSLSYKQTRARGEAPVPYSTIEARYKRDILRAVTAKIRANQLKDQTNSPQRCAVKKPRRSATATPTR